MAQAATRSASPRPSGVGRLGRDRRAFQLKDCRSKLGAQSRYTRLSIFHAFADRARRMEPLYLKPVYKIVIALDSIRDLSATVGGPLSAPSGALARPNASLSDRALPDAIPLAPGSRSPYQLLSATVDLRSLTSVCEPDDQRCVRSRVAPDPGW
jgi:hypothetical protein